MPSDTKQIETVGRAGAEAETPAEPTLADRAHDALARRIGDFRRSVAEAEREIRDDLLRRGGIEGLDVEQALVELGPFAIGRIDPERFSMLLGVTDEDLTPESIDVLGRADRILAGFSTRSRHRVGVEPGGDLRDTVKDGLAQLGLAFGAARAVELARSGVFDPTEHGHLLEPLPFRHWNRAERRMAPPLLVEVRGEDCLPAGLGEFLDGTVTIVLVATGPTTPAPLARLVTPGTFVMQTADPDDLARLDATEHPAVVLLFDEDRPEQACFVHDPDAGATPWSRITVDRMPSDTDVGRGRRAPVWLEELMHLKALAEGPAAPVGAAAGAAAPSTAAVGADAATTGPVAASGADAPDAPVEPADRLAAWLLATTDVSDL